MTFERLHDIIKCQDVAVFTANLELSPHKQPNKEINMASLRFHLAVIAAKCVCNSNTSTDGKSDK